MAPPWSHLRTPVPWDSEVDTRSKEEKVFQDHPPLLDALAGKPNFPLPRRQAGFKRRALRASKENSWGN